MPNQLPVESSGFEGGTLGIWSAVPQQDTVYKWVALSSSTAQAHGGTRSLLMETVTKGAQAWQFTTFGFDSEIFTFSGPAVFSALKDYRLTYWLYVPVGTPLRSHGVSVHWYDSSGNLLPTSQFTYYNGTPEVLGAWTKYEPVFNNSGDVRRARIRFRWRPKQYEGESGFGNEPLWSVGEKRYFDDFHFMHVNDTADVVAPPVGSWSVG